MMTQEESKDQNMDEQETKSAVVNNYLNWLTILKSTIKTQKHEKLHKETKEKFAKLEQENKELRELVLQIQSDIKFNKFKAE